MYSNNTWATISNDNNEEEDLFFSEIPTDILDELCLKSSLIERVDLMDFEHRFAIEDFPIHITIRENVNFLTYDDYMNEDDFFFHT